MQREHDEAMDDAKPVATDLPVAKPAAEQTPSHRPTRAGRVFGGVLAFLSLWQTLNPENRTGAILGLAGIAVSVSWFVSCPKALRFFLTVVLVVAATVGVASR